MKPERIDLPVAPARRPPPWFAGFGARLLRLRPFEVDLAGRRPPVPPISWALLFVGALASGAALLACMAPWQARTGLVAQRTALEEELARIAGADPRGAKPGGTAAPKAAFADADTMVADLRRPWSALLDQLEKAQGRDVHVVSLSVDSRFDSVQLVVEARTIDALVRFSQRAAGKGPLQSLTMTHHEWRDALGAHVVSATMQGALAGGDS